MDWIKSYVCYLIGIDWNTLADLLQKLPPEPKPNNLATLLTVLKAESKDNVIEFSSDIKIVKKSKSLLSLEKKYCLDLASASQHNPNVMCCLLKPC